MESIFLDFQCSKCGVQFWSKVDNSTVASKVREICSESCPNCKNKGTVKRIGTPSIYVV